MKDSDEPQFSKSETETQSHVSETTNIKSYKRRWYVLGVFSLASVLQSAVWNTFGPIAQSAKRVFGWTDAEIGMLPNLGNISYFLFAIPTAWVMDVKGLRVSMLLCTALMLLSVALRCIPCDADIASWLMNVACFINGIAGTISYGGPPLVSATWFPPNQRATATAISSTASYIGVSLAFIIGPLLVPEVTAGPHLTNSTNMTNMYNEMENVTIRANTQSEKDGIMLLMYIECGAVVLLFLMVLLYFPVLPPSPPSITASIERTSYLLGLKQLFRHKRFVLILLAYGIPLGVYGVYSAVLDVILDGINISQTTAGWIGFYTTMAGCGSALLLSRLADLFMRRMKLILLIIYILATGGMIWFVALRLGYLPFNTASVYVSFILSGVFINGSIPLFFELGCEASYPIAEGVTGGILTLMNNLNGAIFLSVLQIPNIGVLWMNWAVLGTTAVPIVLLLLVKEKYTRTDIDVNKEVWVEPMDTIQINTVENKAENKQL